MAVRHQLIGRNPDQVWAVLADPDRYSDWVVGVFDSSVGRGEWPAVGADLRYEVRFGPWRGHGRTVVRRSQPAEAIELEADSGPLGTARIAVELRSWGEHECLAVLDEHPLRGTAGTLHNFVLDSFIQLRHRTMLGRLAAVAEESAPPAPPRPEP